MAEAVELGTGYIHIVPRATGIKKSIVGELGGAGAGGVGSSIGKSLMGGLKSAVAKVAIGATIVQGIKKSIQEGAELEQSLGGIETLFKDSAGTVIKNAESSYKRAGMSANDYMKNVTSFSASLIKSVDGDTNKAAKSADMALVDMSDNANKMGTNLQDIQNAYQGFAKQNYTMLDNLKLGYGGTKSEMERLLADAEKISGQEYDISNLNDVYQAIHVIQSDLGITGTTAQEAASTISGSFGMVKSAFSDLMGNLALGRDISGPMKALVDSSVTFLAGNLIPAIGNIFKALPTVVTTGIASLAPYAQTAFTTILNGFNSGSFLNIFNKLFDQVEAMLPGVLSGIGNFVAKAGTALINNLPAIITTVGMMIIRVRNFLIKNAPVIAKTAGKTLGALAKALIANMPKIIVAIVRINAKMVSEFLKAVPRLLRAGINFITAVGSGIGAGIGAVWGKIKGWIDSKIIGPFRGIGDRIKGFFRFSVPTPNIPLPHFSITPAGWGIGDLVKGKIPKLSVRWYAEGGIVDGATLIGAGEAGKEAIVPLDPFWKKLDEMKTGGDTYNITVNVDAQDLDGVMSVRDFVQMLQRAKALA